MEGMHKLAEEQGVRFHFNANVSAINIENGKATGIKVNTGEGQQTITADVVVGAADYHFIETQLLQKQYQSYDEQYWDKG